MQRVGIKYSLKMTPIKLILFLDRFLELYDTCTKITNTFNNRIYTKPCLINGLLNACKKKNYLCKQFINNKTKTNEIKYKKYKNNLVTILQNYT